MLFLLVKTHNKTKLKYLCKHEGTKTSCFKYRGSGLYWKRHLRKHGYNVTTKIIYETEDEKNFKQKCREYSQKFNIVTNEKWANLVIETGGENTHKGKLLSECHKKKISNAMKKIKKDVIWQSRINKALTGRKFSLEHRQKLSKIKSEISCGTGNPKWKGFWITPKGKFSFLKNAAKTTNIGSVVLSKLCKEPNAPLSIHSLKLLPVLAGVLPGTTPAQLGYEFEKVK